MRTELITYLWLTHMPNDATHETGLSSSANHCRAGAAVRIQKCGEEESTLEI